MYVSDIRKITIWQAVMSVMISGKNPLFGKTGGEIMLENRILHRLQMSQW